MLRHLLPAATVGIGVLAALSLANDWKLTAPLARAWRRHGGTVRWYVASAPATFVYLAILVVTTWVLLGLPEDARAAFLRAQSTNLRHLSSEPVRVLVRSAFFVTKAELVVWFALFAALLAPAERWLGSARTIAAFATGHVLATAGAAVDVWVHVRYLHAPDTLWNVQDTGASYGFMTLAALMVYRVRGGSRILLGAVLAAVVVYGAVEGTGFTARGHALAVLVGLALYPITHHERVRSRRGAGRSLLDLWRRRSADGPDRGRAEGPA